MEEDIKQFGEERVKLTKEQHFERKIKPSEFSVKVIAWMDLENLELYSADRKHRLYGDWETVQEIPGYHIEYCKTIAGIPRYAFFKNK